MCIYEDKWKIRFFLYSLMKEDYGVIFILLILNIFLIVGNLFFIFESDINIFLKLINLISILFDIFLPYFDNEKERVVNPINHIDVISVFYLHLNMFRIAGVMTYFLIQNANETPNEIQKWEYFLTYLNGIVAVIFIIYLIVYVFQKFIEKQETKN